MNFTLIARIARLALMFGYKTADLEYIDVVTFENDHILALVIDGEEVDYMRY